MLEAKIPPQAKDLETAVIGAMMIEPNALDVISDIFGGNNVFYVDANRIVFDAILRLRTRHSPIDTLTVVEELTKTNEIETVGGAYTVVKMTNDVTGANYETHARIVMQKFILRELIRISTEIQILSYDSSADSFEVIDNLERQTIALTNTYTSVSGYSSSETLAMHHQKVIDELMAAKKTLTGVDTGYRTLNILTCGWQLTDLIILAARPSVGKTAFALNVALNAAISGVGVAFFSLEMSKMQLTNRIASIISGIDLGLISRGKMNREQYQVYLKAINYFATLKFYIDDTAAINIFQLRSKARQLVSKKNVGIIFIDYLQLMNGDGDKKKNREQDISTISRSLKALAKELNVPNIALSQLSRDIESRKDKEPMLSDLRESGAIEQDADLVGFLMRDDYQLDKDNIDPSLANKGYLKICKHRNGELIKLAFNTNLSIQKWNEIDFGNNYTAVNQITDVRNFYEKEEPPF